MVEEEINYDDVSETPDYSAKSDFSKAELVKIAVQNCIEKRGQEMKSGFWNMKISTTGSPFKEWHPDTRKEFISTVDALRGLLNPEILRDEKFKSFEEGIKSKVEAVFKNYAYNELDAKYKDENKVSGGILVYTKSDKQFMPEIGAILLVADKTNPKSVSLVPGAWDNYVNAYLDTLLGIYDRLFGALNSLIDQNNYFKQSINF